MTKWWFFFCELPQSILNEIDLRIYVRNIRVKICFMLDFGTWTEIIIKISVFHPHSIQSIGANVSLRFREWKIGLLPCRSGLTSVSIYDTPFYGLLLFVVLYVCVALFLNIAQIPSHRKPFTKQLPKKKKLREIKSLKLYAITISLVRFIYVSYVFCRREMKEEKK